MRFSAKGRYGVRAMIDLALHQSDKPVSARAIASRQEFSADYLEQIFRQLRRQELVRSVRGPTGGFLLAQPPTAITVFDILTALDEHIAIAPCLEGRTPGDDCCPRRTFCAAHMLWNKLGRDIEALLRNTTLEDIVAEARQQQPSRPLHSHMFHI